MKNILKTITAVLVLFTATYSLSSAGVSGEELKTIEVKVKGITCTKGPATIKKSIESIEGVESCDLKGKAKARSVFVVTFNPKKVDEKAIYNAFECTGTCSDPDARPYTVIH